MISDFLLQLSESKEDRKKRNNKVLEDSQSRLETATEEQKNIHNSFIKSVFSKLDGEQLETDMFSIQGFAGSGKTWLTAKIIETLIKAGIKISTTTPTHKAARVVKEMLLENGINHESEDLLKISTIHHFLNLKLDYGFGEDGSADNVTTKPKLVPNKYNECLDYVDVLIVDESSMIGNNLYEEIMKIIDDRAKIVLFIGDPYQLLPVEDENNTIFQKEEIKHFILSKVVRQNEDSDIIKKSQELINILKTQQFPTSIYELFTESSNGIEIVTNDTLFLGKYFNDENDKMTGAYTNNTVDQYNNFIRYHTQDKVLDYLVDDDELVLQSSYTNSKGDILINNGEVVKLAKVTYTKDQANGLNIWKCVTEDKLYFTVLDPSSYTEHKAMLDKLILEAKQATGYNRSKAWKLFFRLKEKYARVKYNYSSTIHKLQGSTYGNMYFDIRGLDKFYRMDRDSVIRLCYVGITRAKDNVFILPY